MPAIKGKVEKVVKKPKKDMKRSPTTQKPVKLSPGLSELLNATELTSSQVTKESVNSLLTKFPGWHLLLAHSLHFTGFEAAVGVHQREELARP